MTVTEISRHLEGHRFRWSSELELQDGIAAALEELDGTVARECWIGPRDRVDFMVDRVAVEVKIGGSLGALTRQVHRYVQYPAVEAIVVVTNLNRLRNLPATINGKPCRVCYLSPLS